MTLLLAGDEGETGYLVPIGAIASGGTEGGSYVFVFDAETSTVTRTAIENSGYRDSNIIVNEGVTAGDIVAVAGVSFLRDGQEVKLMQEQAR